MNRADWVNSQFSTLPRQLGRWQIWFRPYLPSSRNLLVVGLWLAWDTKADEGYVSVCGGTGVERYQKGQDVPLPACISTNIMSGTDQLLDEATRAKDRLVDFLTELDKKV